MDLEAVFNMADNIPRPVTDPLGFHLTNEQLLGVDFSFFPVTHASEEKKEASGFSMFPFTHVSVDRKEASEFNEPIESGTPHVQHSNPSALIDSDDDFGDFTSGPADTLHSMDASLSADPFGFPVNTTFELDVGKSFDMFGFHTSSSQTQMSPDQEDLFGHLSATVEIPADKARSESTVSPNKLLENNSDDDWGDFVENSTSANWDNSQEFDWFDTSRQNVGQSLPTESIASNVKDSAVSAIAWESGVWTGPSKVEVPRTEQKATNFSFDDVGFSAGGNISSSKGSKAEADDVENNEMSAQQKTTSLQRTLSGQKMGKGALSSAPIPLSLFGDSELEVENSNTELPDPVTKSFQGHSRSKALSTGSLLSGSTNLSDLIATLYTESQPDLQINSLSIMSGVDLIEIKDNVNSSKNLFDTVSVNDGSSSLEECMFSLNLSLEHAADLGSTKEVYGTAMDAKLHDAAVHTSDDNQPMEELQLQEATTSVLLDSTSMADRCTFVKAWASMLAVCASELELALNIWKQAQNADVHLDLLADLQGKKYFAAIGQVYVVALILAATLNFYKPWLRLASKEAESLQADLERCKAAWLQTNLKEGVHLALDGLQGSVPSTVVSWKRIEGFAAVALEAYLQAAKATMHSICRMSLLPMAPFNYTGLPPVEWFGSSYLLPLANMWVNCVSHEPPSTSLTTQLKTL